MEPLAGSVNSAGVSEFKGKLYVHWEILRNFQKTKPAVGFIFVFKSVKYNL